MSVEYPRVFTISCPGSLLANINANGLIVPGLEQIIQYPTQWVFVFSVALSPAEVIEFDNTLAAFVCPPLIDPNTLDINTIPIIGEILSWDGTTWIAIPESLQDLFETISADTGSVLAASPTETLQVIGGAGITTAIAGNVLTIDISGTDDLGSVTVGFNTTFALPLTMTDVLWDITHTQNDTSVIEHDPVNIERILIKETGLYFVNFSISFDADAGEEQISAQVLINGTTVMPGSFRLASEDDEINDLSNAIAAELTDGDYITLQSMASGTGNTCHNSTNFSVTRARGTKGDQGNTGVPGGGSTVSVLDDGVAVPNTPHSIMNFVGMEATDAGSGQADIKNLFGSEFQKAESAGISTTSSIAFQNKVTLNTTALPAGTYRVGIHYGWNHDAVSNDFEGRIMEDAVQLGELHKQEPKDSAGGDPTGTTQRYYLDRIFYRTLTSGVHTFDIEFRTDTDAINSSIWEATIELWRVS